MMGFRVIEADYLAVYEKRQLRWTGQQLPDRSTDKTQWQCPLGHSFWCSYAKIVHDGVGCSVCNPPPTKKTAADYHQLAEIAGIEWIADEIPTNIRERTKWYSPKREEVFENTYQQIVHRGPGRGSAYKKTNYTSEDYHELAHRHNLLWQGDHLPSQTSHLTQWCCQRCNYQFTTSYHGVSKALPEKGCAKCARCAPMVREDYLALEQKVGKRWCGDKLPKGSKVHTAWRCEVGHRYMASYNSISRGHGCPDCALVVNGKRASSVQLDLALLIQEQLDLVLEINVQCVSYYVDILLAEGTVIEYDGWFYHKHRSHEDAIRNRTLIEAGYALLVIQGANQLPALDQLENALTSLRQGQQQVILTLSDWHVDR